MSGLIWEEPPSAARRTRTAWERVADDLRARPGEWARIRDGLNGANAGTIAHRIRTGFYRGFRPAGDFEAVSRTQGTASAVYARYLGDGGAS